MGGLPMTRMAIPLSVIMTAAILTRGAAADDEVAASTALPTAPVVEVQPVDPWEVYLFLDRYCVECHGGHLKKPKGQFGYILDLRRLIDENYVIPEVPGDSDLYISLITDDPDFKMPPDDSDGPKPSADEIARIHDWILAGAPIDPLGPEAQDGLADLAAAATSESVPDADEAAASTPRPTIPRIIGRFHPIIVHFPIALLICAAGASVFSRMRGRQDWLHGMARGSLWIGAAGAVLAVATGWVNATLEGFSGGETDTHRWLGVATAVLAVTAVIACEFLSRINAVRWQGGRTLQVALLVLVAVLVALAGHTGGLLSYGADYFWGL